jgi:hypothetical protein
MFITEEGIVLFDPRFIDKIKRYSRESYKYNTKFTEQEFEYMSKIMMLAKLNPHDKKLAKLNRYIEKIIVKMFKRIVKPPKTNAKIMHTYLQKEY